MESIPWRATKVKHPGAMPTTVVGKALCTLFYVRIVHERPIKESR